MIEAGQTFIHDFSFTQADVIAFAQLTGDSNPLHLDADYAAKTVFRKPIMHGMLGGSVFSKVLGTLFPGEGSIYLKQSLDFLAPLYVDIVYESVFTVKSIGEKSTAIIETQVLDKTSRKVCVTGEAVVMNRQQIPKVK
jgi:acyl dehydratase